MAARRDCAAKAADFCGCTFLSLRPARYDWRRSMDLGKEESSSALGCTICDTLGDVPRRGQCRLSRVHRLLVIDIDDGGRPCN